MSVSSPADDHPVRRDREEFKVSNLSSEPQAQAVSSRTSSRSRGPAGTLTAPSAHGPAGGPSAGGDGLQAATPRRRPAVVLLSVLTALWLAAQLAAGLAMKVHTWPVAGFPMFSEKRPVVSERRLEARTRSGRLVVVKPADFGLTDLQFLNHLRGMVSETGMVKPKAVDRLGRLASAWNRRHPDDPAVSMTFTHVVYPLPYGTPPRPPRVVRWSAP
jgi:hypothetical protein